jgi:hypothetical protein
MRRRSHRTGQPVENGRVLCPLQGRDVDIDACVQCGHLRAIVPGATGDRLRCRPPRRSDATADTLRHHLPSF